MTNSETVFSKIIRGEIPAKIVHETDTVLAFHDVHPQAPVHVLVIPKREIKSMAEATVADTQLLGELLLACSEVAAKLGLSKNGYRIVTNIGSEGGQTVPHLHFHVLGGRGMKWPPG